MLYTYSHSTVKTGVRSISVEPKIKNSIQYINLRTLLVRLTNVNDSTEIEFNCLTHHSFCEHVQYDNQTERNFIEENYSF